MPGERPPEADVVVDEEARRKAEQFVEQEEGAVRRLGGRTGVAVTFVAVAMSLYHLYAAYAIIPAHILRATHVRSEEHTSELQSRRDLVCRLLLEKKKIVSSMTIPVPNDGTRCHT